MFPIDFNERLTESPHTKKFLIAVDLKDYSENISNVFLNFLGGIPSEFTFFHSLEGELTKDEAELKMGDLIQKLSYGPYDRPYFRYKSIIFESDAVSSIEVLHNAHHFDLIVIGSSNNLASKKLGNVAKKIFLDLQANFLMVPPQAEVKQLKNVSILLEDSLESLPLMNIFRRYLKCQDVFINLVQCRKVGERGDNFPTLLKDFQTFFNENYVFPVIFEYENLMESVCQLNAESMVDFFGICWDDNSKLFKSLSEINFEAIPAFIKIPLLISKEKQVVENPKILKEVFA